jgi:hypothetical protein
MSCFFYGRKINIQSIPSTLIAIVHLEHRSGSGSALRFCLDWDQDPHKIDANPKHCSHPLPRYLPLMYTFCFYIWPFCICLTFLTSIFPSSLFFFLFSISFPAAQLLAYFVGILALTAVYMYIVQKTYPPPLP